MAKSLYEQPRIVKRKFVLYGKEQNQTYVLSVRCRACYFTSSKEGGLEKHVTQKHGSFEEYCKLAFGSGSKPLRSVPTCDCGKKKKPIGTWFGFQEFCSQRCKERGKRRSRKPEEKIIQALGKKIEVTQIVGRKMRIVRDDKVFWVQGYEACFVRDLDLFSLSADDLALEVPKIIYRCTEDEEVARRYTADFYVPKDELLIEVKSVYTFNAGRLQAEKKIEYAQRFGFDVLLLVYKSLQDCNPMIRRYYKTSNWKETAIWRNHLMSGVKP